MRSRGHWCCFQEELVRVAQLDSEPPLGSPGVRPVLLVGCHDELLVHTFQQHYYISSSSTLCPYYDQKRSIENSIHSPTNTVQRVL